MIHKGFLAGERGRLLPLSAAALLMFSGAGTAAAKRRAVQSDDALQVVITHRLQERHLDANNNINVTVREHQVTLTGTVETLAQKRKVLDQARAVDDDAFITDNLTVRAADLSDQQIADNVAKAIRSYVFYDIYDWITGNVQNGVLTLSGSTHLPWRVNDYQQLAEGVVGVREIHNQIQALPTSIFDDQMRVQLARAIYHYPGFERYALQPYPPIHIVVNNGNVTLEGVVDGQADRNVAEQVARSRVLAFSVTNHLRVRGQD